MYLSSGDFIASLLGALRRHRGSEEVAKQVAKCLIDWSQLAGAQTATADASDRFLRAYHEAEQEFSRALLAQTQRSHPVASGPAPSTGGSQRAAAPPRADDDDAAFQAQLAQALALSQAEAEQKRAPAPEDEQVRGLRAPLPLPPNKQRAFPAKSPPPSQQGQRRVRLCVCASVRVCACVRVRA